MAYHKVKEAKRNFFFNIWIYHNIPKISFATSIFHIRFFYTYQQVVRHLWWFRIHEWLCSVRENKEWIAKQTLLFITGCQQARSRSVPFIIMQVFWWTEAGAESMRSLLKPETQSEPSDFCTYLTARLTTLLLRHFRSPYISHRGLP